MRGDLIKLPVTSTSGSGSPRENGKLCWYIAAQRIAMNLEVVCEGLKVAQLCRNLPGQLVREKLKSRLELVQQSQLRWNCALG